MELSWHWALSAYVVFRHFDIIAGSPRTSCGTNLASFSVSQRNNELSKLKTEKLNATLIRHKFAIDLETYNTILRGVAIFGHCLVVPVSIPHMAQPNEAIAYDFSSLSYYFCVSFRLTLYSNFNFSANCYAISLLTPLPPPWQRKCQHHPHQTVQWTWWCDHDVIAQHTFWQSLRQAISRPS